MERSLPLAALLVLLAGAFAVRALHIDFGLPAHYHPDETNAVNEIEQLDRGGGLHGYRHPPLQRMLAYVGLLAYHFSTGESRHVQSDSYRALRRVSMVAGTFAVAAVYFLARPLVGPWPAVLAAALYTVTPLVVVSSKYGVPDTLLACLFAVGLAVQIGITKHPATWRYAACGFVVGLAVGAKYPGGLLGISAVAAHVLAKRQGVKATALSITVFVLGLGAGLWVGFPLLFTEWGDIRAGVAYELEHVYQKGHLGLRVSGADFHYLYYLRAAVLPALGPVATPAAVAGLVVLAVTRPRQMAVLLAAAFPYYVAIECAYIIPPAPERYVLPLVALYAVAAVAALRAALAGLRNAQPWIRAAATCGTAILLLAWPTFRTAQVVSGLVPDSRDTMKTCLLRSLPAGSVIAAGGVGAYVPPLSGTTLRYRPYVEPQPLTFTGYYLATSFIYQRYLDFPGYDPQWTRFYRRLFNEGRIICQVSPGNRSYLFNNPSLTLYEIARPFR